MGTKALQASSSANVLKASTPMMKKKGGKKGHGVPLRQNHAHVIPTGLKKEVPPPSVVKSNAAVNQSTSLNRTTDTMVADMESERGSLKYVSANVETKKN